MNTADDDAGRSWEIFYNLQPSAPDAGADSDSDGLTNLREFHAGTDPRQPQSVFQLLSVSGPHAGQTTLTWTSNPGYHYRIESAPSRVR